MKMNKKGIQLSINFIVMFILGMAMFGAGLTIMRQIFSDTDEIKERLSEQQRKQLERYLGESSEPIVTIIKTIELRPKEHDIMGIGVRNDFPDEKKFYLEAKCDAAFYHDNTQICDFDVDGCGVCQKYIYVDGGGLKIPPNEKKIFDVFITLDNAITKGIYNFNVRVCLDALCSEQYGVTKKLNVIVK